ncbi:MAG TPA: DNA gyrase inhibitor YacG [Nannocystis exedens]|nr:DNA gyrase inhibitor YacG [Nannocystis exedens]
MRTVLIRCPTCRRELPHADEDYRHRPFCSKRCKTIDLARWLNEEYRIPSTAPVDGNFDELLLH